MNERPAEDLPRPRPSRPPRPPGGASQARLAATLSYLLRCDAPDPDHARTGRIVAGVLLTVIPFSFAAFVVFALLERSIEPAVPGFVSGCVLVGVFLYNRRGHAERAAKATLAVVLLLLNLAALWSRGESYPVVFVPYMWAIPIGLSGALLPWRAVIVTWLASLANVTVLHVAFLSQQSGLGSRAAASWILSAELILTELALCTAFVRHQSDRYNGALRERNAELRDNQRELSRQREELARLNDSLESQVRARTAELVTARDEAVRASRVKSDFMANMSHEMRTPMNAVLGMTGLLLDTSLTNDQRTLAADVRKAGAHLLGVIDDILDLSRLESGDMAFHEVPFDVRGCVEDAAKLVAHAALEKGLALKTSVAADVPAAVVADPSRIRQVLVHLLVNGIKFTPRGSVSLQVDVAAPREGADERAMELRFAVVDTGIGIPKERRDGLFAPFAQIDTSATRRYGGTGVGLVLCKQIVERLGGSLTMESEPGAGSTFAFTARARLPREEAPTRLPVSGSEPSRTEPATPTRLPVSGSEPSPTEPATPTRLPVSGSEGASPMPETRASEAEPVPLDQTAKSHPLRILSVEDNPMNQKVILAVLRRMGYAADTASNGVEAVQAVEKSPYDVVLMDIQMPEMDGMEASRTIHERVPAAACPHIIALTAHAMAGYRDQCLDAGMDDYLPKPMSPEMLQAALLRAPARVRPPAELH